MCYIVLVVFLVQFLSMLLTYNFAAKMLQFFLCLATLADRSRRCRCCGGLAAPSRRHSTEGRRRRQRVRSGDDRPLERVILADEVHDNSASFFQTLPARAAGWFRSPMTWLRLR